MIEQPKRDTGTTARDLDGPAHPTGFIPTYGYGSGSGYARLADYADTPDGANASADSDDAALKAGD